MACGLSVLEGGKEGDGFAPLCYARGFRGRGSAITPCAHPQRPKIVAFGRTYLVY